MERIRPKIFKKYLCRGRLRQYELYISVGGFLAIALAGSVLYDALAYTVFRSPLNTTQPFTYGVLVSRLFTFSNRLGLPSGGIQISCLSVLSEIKSYFSVGSITKFHGQYPVKVR